MTSNGSTPPLARALLTVMQVTNEIVDRLCVWATSNGSVAALWLFGSRARNQARPDSDYDIALELMPKRNAYDDWAFGNAVALMDQWKNELRSIVGDVSLVVFRDEPSWQVRSPRCRCQALAMWSRVNAPILAGGRGFGPASLSLSFALPLLPEAQPLVDDLLPNIFGLRLNVGIYCIAFSVINECNLIQIETKRKLPGGTSFFKINDDQRCISRPPMGADAGDQFAGLNFLAKVHFHLWGSLGHVALP
jgi:predicted nucleotidyltransferase